MNELRDNDTAPQNNPPSSRGNDHHHLARLTHTEQSKHSRFTENVWIVVGGCLRSWAGQISCILSRGAFALFPGSSRNSFGTPLDAPPHSFTASSGIRFLLLIFLVALLCGVVFLCLHCWLRRPRMDSPRRTMAVFAVGDLDPVYGELSEHFQTSCLEPCGLWWIEKLTSGKQICELRTRHSLLETQRHAVGRETKWENFRRKETSKEKYIS